nr:hypothetical protein [Tanacetum cinerariifolium]
AARTMLADSKLPTKFWAEVINTACYVQNKAFRVYNTKTVEENLHARFLEDKPIITSDGPTWLFDIDVLTKLINYVSVIAGTNSNDFIGTEESIGAGQASKETGSRKDYILTLLWKDGSLFDSSSKNASNDEPQPSSNVGNKDDEGVSKESRIGDKERPSINTASPNVNTDGPRINIASTNDNAEVDLSNISTTYLVPSTPNTRILKDHSLDHVIGDVQSGVQTRRITKTTNEQGFISAIYKGKAQEDLHTYLFACFLSQIEPKKVWTLVDLPYGKRAIGTKWIYRNKKDERGIVVRNKERLVTQGYTKKEGIDYDEIFSPVARI